MSRTLALTACFAVMLSFVEGCPLRCICQGSLVDCSFQGLKMVPIDIPKDTQRLDLQGNNITMIRKTDFRGLNKIKVLQLLENQIHTIEKGAFDDMVQLQKLRLNRNQVQAIPDLLFQNMDNLNRLDLSDNKLKAIGQKTFQGASALTNLQLDNNEIGCLADAAIKELRHIEILTMNKNNITTLSRDIFSKMSNLRLLRISENNLVCDCHLSWLAKWLRMHPTLALFTKCNAPAKLRGAEIAELQETNFKCNLVESQAHIQECTSAPVCPNQCTCKEGIVDCRGKGLWEIPQDISESTTELRLEHNQITKIPSNAFVELNKLRRIDLSNNQISEMSPEAFAGLKSLNSLVLYGNKITELPQGLFKGLASLQLLLLNANKISCLRLNTFEDLQQLNLLSLYDNKIQSIANDTFVPLKNIQTLHLARNPFICDCNLRWLSEYLHTNPIETSGARCEMPKRMQRKKIGYISPTKFRCKGSEEFRTMNAHLCEVNIKCPAECQCEGTRVDCSGRGLNKIPAEIPNYTTELMFTDNNLRIIPRDSALKKLPYLQKLDFRNNQIATIEDGAFEGNPSLIDLQLTENSLTYIRGTMFAGLKSLQTLMLRSNKLGCINNKTFVGMTDLKLLSLYDNEVQCIQTGSFERLSRLSTLNLLANPFMCNCNLGWLGTWLRRQNVVTGNLRCASPATMSNIPLMDLPARDFVCAEANEIHGCNMGPPPCCPDPDVAIETNSCEQRAYCPPKCTCTGTVIRCSNQELEEIPKDIPLDTTELYLNGNKIKEISENLGRLTKLNKIDLSNNELAALPEHSFYNNNKLSTLILSYNKLQCIQSVSLSGLTQLRVLSLHGNNLSTIPYGSFEDLKSLTHLALGGNPLYCDCNLKWLSDWIKKDYRETGIAACSGPDTMLNRVLLNEPSGNFQCDDNPDPFILSKCNVCFTYPCKNGATCHLKKFNDFSCECPVGFHGEHCDQEIDACFGNPCENGGTCKVLESYGRFGCYCQTGFEGDRCETNIDDCIGHRCEHDATCVDLVGEYQCNCQKGFTGDFCEHEIDFCTEYNPCHEGSTCVPEDRDYKCSCPPGFGNKNCSYNIDDCVGHICQNGGVCEDLINGYKCNCPDGVTGSFCEIRPMVPMYYPQTSICMNHDCQNGGACSELSDSTEYECKCPDGFDGKKCEKLGSIHFEQDSYAQLPRLPFSPDLNITIVLTTTQASGIVLYHGFSQHIAVELFRGHIRVSFYIGNYPTSTMYSYEKVSDGKLHVLEMLVRGKNFTMRIDNGLARTILNEGEKQAMDLKEPAYLGGIPSKVRQRAFKNWHVRDGSSFSGCMTKVIINGRQVDFMSSTVIRHKVMPGCPDVQQKDAAVKKNDPCNPNPCDNGNCRVKKNGKFSCNCKKGYSGTLCHMKPTCDGVIHREYYTDTKTGCKSKSKVRHRLCQGSCGGGTCCRPHKIKKRKIRVFCERDLSSYVVEIPVIRKCKCKPCNSRTDIGS